VRDGVTAWRGYMPLGGEQTYGYIDWKGGLYVYLEHADDHPLVGFLLHGKNEFPHQVIINMRHEVLDYVNKVMKARKNAYGRVLIGLEIESERASQASSETRACGTLSVFQVYAY
jgi:isopenicillin N synthase-like dioxygenase